MEKWRKKIAQLKNSLDDQITWTDFQDICLRHEIYGLTTFSHYHNFQQLLVNIDNEARQKRDFAVSFCGVEFLTKTLLENNNTKLFYHCNHDSVREQFGAIQKLQDWKQFLFTVNNCFVLSDLEPHYFKFCYSKSVTNTSVLQISFKKISQKYLNTDWSKDGF